MKSTRWPQPPPQREDLVRGRLGNRTTTASGIAGATYTSGSDVTGATLALNVGNLGAVLPEQLEPSVAASATVR